MQFAVERWEDEGGLILPAEYPSHEGAEGVGSPELWFHVKSDFATTPPTRPQG
jgi:hypothetical protein